MYLEENIIYCDSSYDWKRTINGRGTGTICIIVNFEKPIVKKIQLYFPGLKQLNNRFELRAIEEAKEIIKIRNLKDAFIFSDSQVAVGWAKCKNVKWVPREKNLAGIYLDKNKNPFSQFKNINNFKKKKKYKKIPPVNFKKYEEKFASHCKVSRYRQVQNAETSSILQRKLDKERLKSQFLP